MLVHCNSRFQSYVTWFLSPSSSFYNRSIEFGICPHCEKEIACLVEYRKEDDYKSVRYVKQGGVNKLREQYKNEIEYKSTDLIIPKGAPYGWRYGLNKERINRSTGKVTLEQYACDFYGNKEIVKTRQTDS